MLLSGFRKLSFLHSLKNTKAFTMIELLIGTVIFLGISAGAYEVWVSSTRKAQEAQQKAKFSRGLKTFLESFRHQTENTTSLPNAKFSALMLNRPSLIPNCIDTDPSSLAWGLIPYPGKTTSTIPTTFAAFDPSTETANNTTFPNDGIRMVYMPVDSSINYLLNDTSSNNTIRVRTYPIQNLNIGDFAIVANSRRKELIRITGINGQFIDHASSSIWNVNFTENISNGLTGGEVPIIYKVNIVTYALDPSTQTLMMDDHTADDGFTPPNTFVAPGLASNWQTVANGITKFQVIYRLMDDSETRTPQVGIPDKRYISCATSSGGNCGCENQLGNPSLQNIRTLIEYSDTKIDPTSGHSAVVTANTFDQFNPTSLKKPQPSSGTTVPNSCPTTDLFTMIGGPSSTTPNPACSNPYCVCTDQPDHQCGVVGKPSCPVGSGGSGPGTISTGYGGGSG